MKYLTSVIVSFFFCAEMICVAQVDQSVLAEGIWYKMPIKESGIYVIDNDFFEKNNIDLSPDQYFHIYGAPGGMLPEEISQARIEDLVELPLFQHREAYLFYSEGADVWQIEEQSVQYQNNIYDKNNYIYIKIDNVSPLLITQSKYVEDSEYRLDKYTEVQRYEVDKVNPLGSFPTTHGSGQEWYGDEFSNLRTKEYTDQFDLRDRIIDAPITIDAEFVGRSSGVSTIEIQIGDEIFQDDIGSVRVGDVEAIHARKGVIRESFQSNALDPEISLHYLNNGTESKGWLDFIELRFLRPIRQRENEPLFVSNQESTQYESVAYSIAQSVNTEHQVWNISNPISPTQMEIKNGEWSYRTNGLLQRFVLFEANNALELEGSPIAIPNQNIHGIVDADMIIVYHKMWQSEAERLATHRAEHSGLLVEIVDVEEIYNEFSSGRQDPTAIRDFARMVYQRSENFRYLLLLGDASYDFRGIDNTLLFQSFVPTYETKESLDPLEAFPSDDYFAQLDDDEGLRLRGDLDVAVGRAPVRNAEEARNFVDKIISYDTNENSYGAWRTRIAFLADDEDSNLHLNDADVIARKVQETHPNFNQKKIYWDAFLQESTPGGNRYPEANEQLNSDIENGLLVVNYLGHGGPKGWSQERVLNLDDIVSWSNIDRLPLVITATCSFTGFDDPSLTTAGEETMHNPSGGAVGLFTTVRSVYASQNFRLTSAVFDTIFSKVDGEYMTIGEVMQSAKNTRPGDIINARKFFLIGDPSMRLAIPRHSIETLEFDGKQIAEKTDTIGASRKVKIAAHIIDNQGNINVDFNGVAEITLFDKTSEIQTLRNDASSFEKTFNLQNNTLYKGEVTVVNGFFEAEFIVPLDIDYSYGNGKISYYALSEDGVDASGFFENFIIGGTSEEGVNDDKGPEIEIFIDGFDFKDGDDIQSPNPMVWVNFRDESGINVSNVSIGHEIVAILDERSGSTEILNEFYKGNIDDFTSGSLSYLLDNLLPGQHTLTIRAFDVFNNAGTATVTFNVTENTDNLLTNVEIGPNPFNDMVNFYVENEANVPVDLDIYIYDVIGKLVHRISRNGVTNNGQIPNLSWSGEGDYGSLQTGTYLYEVVLSVIREEKTLSSGLKKMVMLK